MSNREQVVLNGRYELRRRVGRGGMAEVYLARDRMLDRLVAIKILFPEFATDPAFVARFRREAQRAANLNHPNIVGVYDWGKERGTYYIVMEYVDGRTVSDIIRNDGPLDAQRAAGVAAEVASALGFAHRNGVVHRDVKPGNVLITAAGEVKVADFGIAQALTADPEDNLTQTGSVMGTATYFSPEQAQGKKIDARSDLYSLGVVLYEMVAGRPPFTAESPVAIAYKHVQEPVPSLREQVPDLPSDYEAITAKALAKDPELRYQDAGALREDLLRFRDGRPVQARSALAGATAAALAAPAPATAAVPAAAPVDDGGGTRSSGWFFAAIAVLLLILGGLLFAFGRQLGIFEPQTKSLTVPTVVGRNVEDATRILEAAKFKVRSIGKESSEPVGDVLEQDPGAGEQADQGSTILLTVSQGIGTATLPDLVGLTEADAREQLAKLGFTDVRVESEESDKPAGEVLRTDPLPGDYAKTQRITLTVAIPTATTTTASTTTTAPATTTTQQATTTTAPATTTTQQATTTLPTTTTVP